jgi:hypothetical protein
MRRRASERLRASWAGLLRGELDDVRAELTTTLTTSLDELRHDVVMENDALETRARGRDIELLGALHRIADSFERVADGLEAERRDRATQLDAVEFLLREIVIGSVAPTAVRPTVLGGSIDAALADGSVDIDLSDPPIPVDALVEVRSRFHDHWVHGFAVVAYVEGPARRGYRLRRITDADQLPLLFDAADVRRAIAPPKQPVADISNPLEEPEASMWR